MKLAVVIIFSLVLALAASFPAEKGTKKDTTTIQGSKCKDNLKKHPQNDDCLCICLDKSCTYMCEETDSQEVLSSLLKKVTTSTTTTTTSTTTKPDSTPKAKATRRPASKTKATTAAAESA